MYQKENNPQDSSQRTLLPSNFKSHTSLNQQAAAIFRHDPNGVLARLSLVLQMKAPNVTRDSDISKPGRSSWSPAAGSAKDGQPAPARGSRPAFLPMMGFSEVEARGAHSPGLAAQHRSRLSTHSRRSRLAIAPAASRRLSKAQLAGHRGRLPRRRRRRRRRGGRSPDRAGAGAVGWGGAPPRRPVGNAVPARAADGSGGAVAARVPLLGPRSAACDPAAGASARRPVRRHRKLLCGPGVDGILLSIVLWMWPSVPGKGAQDLEGEPASLRQTESCNQAGSGPGERLRIRLRTLRQP